MPWRAMAVDRRSRRPHIACCIALRRPSASAAFFRATAQIRHPAVHIPAVPMSAPAQSPSDSSSGGTAAPLVRRPSLGILIAVTALGPMALNIFIPSMPGMTVVFGADYSTIQLTLTLYLLGLGIAQLRSEEHTSEL